MSDEIIPYDPTFESHSPTETEWISAAFSDGRKICVGRQPNHHSGDSFAHYITRTREDGKTTELKFGMSRAGCTAMAGLYRKHGIVTQQEEDARALLERIRDPFCKMTRGEICEAINAVLREKP